MKIFHLSAFTHREIFSIRAVFAVSIRCVILVPVAVLSTIFVMTKTISHSGESTACPSAHVDVAVKDNPAIGGKLDGRALLVHRPQEVKDNRVFVFLSYMYLLVLWMILDDLAACELSIFLQNMDRFTVFRTELPVGGFK